VSRKGPVRDDERAIAVALFRFGVLAPLLEPAIDRSLRDRVRAVAATEHADPLGGARRISERSIWTWLALYRAGGAQALRPHRRADTGTARAVADEALARAIALRKELPARTTRTLLDILAREGLLAGKPPHRATLDRHLVRAAASRKQLRVLGRAATRKLLAPEFGALWVGDYHHGPLVLAPGGRLVVAKLGAFLDHATRYPVASRWYLAEDLASLRDTLLRALLVFGPCLIAYVDRGAVYRAEQLAYSLACIGTRLVHSRPYYSEGRGLIERWWQLSGEFEKEIATRETPPTIHELNRLWEAWVLLRYLEVPHSELGKTPAEAIAHVERKPLEPELARELFLVRADRTVHPKDATVSVEARRFVVDATLRGRKVELRYDPADLSSVVVHVDGRRFGRAFPQEAVLVGGPKPPRRDPEPAPAARTDYLGMLRADFDERLLRHTRPVAYRDLGATDPGFDQARFFAVLADLAGVVLRGEAQSEAARFFDTYGPLPERLVRVGVEHAVRLHGRSRHVRVYLAAVRSLLLAEMKSPPSPPPPKGPTP
jgi:putative transposase